MLEVVGDDADEAHSEGDGRVEALVDDAIEIGAAEPMKVGHRRRMDGVVVLEQQPAADRDGADLLARLSVARRLRAERKAEALLEALGRVHLLAAGDFGDMVVLHPAQVPDQPGDRIGAGIGSCRELLLGEVLDGAVHGLPHAVEGVGEHLDDVQCAPFVPGAGRWQRLSFPATVAGESKRGFPARGSTTPLRSLKTWRRLAGGAAGALGQTRVDAG